MSAPPGICRVRAIAAGDLAQWAGWADRTLVVRLAHAHLFVYDLWGAAERGSDPTHDCLVEMGLWLGEIGIRHEVVLLDLSTRLIAIPDRDEAFLFAMRFG